MTRERGSLHGVPGVESDPEIQGGAPCIAGTRIPVALALTCLAALIEDGRPAPLVRLADQYPSLTRSAVDAALRYAARATERDDIATVTELRRRVQAAEKAARTRIDETKEAGFSLGRGLAAWAAKDAERRAAATADVLERARAVHAEQCQGARPTFRPQQQTRFGGADAAPSERGDCFAACLASILGVDLAELPDFCVDPLDGWGERVNAWLRTRGLFMITFNSHDLSWMPPGALVIGAGPGPRGHRHCCVYDSKGLVHDPHPSGAGLLQVESHDVLVVLVAQDHAPDCALCAVLNEEIETSQQAMDREIGETRERAR